MKALVLAGGQGSRLSGVTDTKNKCMHEFRGRPLIQYSLENAAATAVEEIVIVVGYKAESIINRFGHTFNGTKVKYVIQWERKGVVHAIDCSREALDGADFMLFLADEMLFSPRHEEMLREFGDAHVFALCGGVWVSDITQISKTYCAIYDEKTHRMFRLIEKPRRALNNLMGTGNCMFRNEIFSYIPYTPINPQRGERELPDLVQCAIDDGRYVKFFNIGGAYVNVNTLDDLAKLESSDADDDAAPTGVPLAGP